MIVIFLRKWEGTVSEAWAATGHARRNIYYKGLGKKIGAGVYGLAGSLWRVVGNFI